jgi:hypothetical protein
MAASYLQLNATQVLAFANGTVIDTYSVTAPGSTITDVGTALTYLDSQSWTLNAIFTLNSVLTYLFSQTTTFNYTIANITEAGIYNYPATRLVGFKNNSVFDQDVNLVSIIYDNPSVPSGPILDSVASPTATQVITYPTPGLPVLSGGITVVVTLTVAINGNGIQVLYF